jgi:hypothetical protein
VGAGEGLGVGADAGAGDGRGAGVGVGAGTGAGAGEGGWRVWASVGKVAWGVGGKVDRGSDACIATGQEGAVN